MCLSKCLLKVSIALDSGRACHDLVGLSTEEPDVWPGVEGFLCARQHGGDPCEAGVLASCAKAPTGQVLFPVTQPVSGIAGF